MRSDLQAKSLRWLHQSIHQGMSAEKKVAIAAWSKDV
jgi:hypothetical protein